MTGRPYRDRREAGRYLARKLADYAGRPDVLVLALPRGGVPVAYEVARALDAPLDVLTVRKLGVPGEEELAMGAVASGGTVVINEEIVRAFGIWEEILAKFIDEKTKEIDRRERFYRSSREPVSCAKR